MIRFQFRRRLRQTSQSGFGVVVGFIERVEEANETRSVALDRGRIET